MAKILIVTYSGYGNWFSLRLLEEKHSVDIYFNGKKSSPELYCMGNICPNPIVEKPDFSKYDLILFDLTGKPALADEALTLSPTIGDGSFATQLENDRLMGIKIMEDADINVPPYETFSDIGEAKRYIRKTNKKYVFKPFGGQGQDTAMTYVSKSPEDLIMYLNKLSSSAGKGEFLLQEVVEGTEVSVEGWFNGEDFFLINGTLEEKKFMDGGRGPNTGCAGNLVFTFEELNPPLIFREGLGKMKDILQQVDFRGPIDLNTIVTATEIYGLEWTPRFGYDAACTLFHIIASDLGEFMGAIASGQKPDIRIKNPFAAAIRISIPPYPSEIDGHHHPDIPVQGLEEEEAIWRTYYLYDVCMDGNNLVTAGINGLITVPIASGQTIPEAFDKVQDRINKVQVPNMQYRGDILSCTNKRWNMLRQQGWLR